MKKNLPVILTAMYFALLSLTANAQVASNPPYVIEQAIIGSGGGTITAPGNTFSITSSIGQPITAAGSASSFTIRSGFFTAPALSPTAATVTVSGRVISTTGGGVRNIMVMLTDSSGVVHLATTTSFGFYSFYDIPVGDTYILTARAKHYQFIQPTLVVTVTDELNDVNFIARPEPR